MLQATLINALKAVRVRIVTADRQATDWLAERDRRRRQEATFLRGLVRLTGSQHKAALVAGVSQSVISRTLNPAGHLKKREATQAVRDATKQNVASDPLTEPDEELMPTNVVNLRRRRPDWQPLEPRRGVIGEWFQEYLGWTRTARATARMMIFNHGEEGRLPDDAYESEPAHGNGAVGSKKRSTARTRRTRVRKMSAR